MTDAPLHVVSSGPPPPGVTPPTGATGRRLVEVVVALGFASQEQVDAAAQTGQSSGRPAERVLLEQGAITSEQLWRAIAERYELDYLDLAAFDVDRAAVRLLDPEIATRHGAVPVAFVDEHTLLVAIADPANAPALSDIETRTRLTVRPAVASAEGIAAVIAGDGPVEETNVEQRAERQSEEIVVGGGAGDLATHVPEPAADESAVVRVREPDTPRPGLDELVLRGPELERALESGCGAVLVAGISNAARLAWIDAVRGAATTAERRVVVADSDLRAALAADPDVLVVPSVRDREAATAALDAALDGVLVIAGLPAPDAASARMRLHDWGVEPFLIEHGIACTIGVRPHAPGVG